MSKIIKLRTNTDNVVEFLESLIEEVKQENIDNMIIACKCPDSSILTGYTSNVDFGNKLELVGHIQVDITRDMIQESYIN